MKIKNQELLKENQITNFVRQCQKTVSTTFSKVLKRGLFQLTTSRQFIKTILTTKLIAPLTKVLVDLIRWVRIWKAKMIGSMEKGMKSAELATAPVGSFDGVDLPTLPKYICFRAAILKEKLTLKYLLVLAVALNIVQFAANRVEIGSVYEMLRKKDYILAFTTQGFVPVSPNMVPDSHVEHAVLQFLNLLGNVNPVNIDEQYMTLASWMAPPLKARFQSEIQDWKDRVKTDNISTVLTVGDREIVSNEKGKYKVTAIGRRDTYVDNQFLGHGDLVIEMELSLVRKRIFTHIYSKS